jgi:hypothetical protein
MRIESKEKCALCPRDYELQEHHLNKENIIVLCVRCLNDLHYALRQFPATERAVRQYRKVTQDEFQIKRGSE